MEHIRVGWIRVHPNPFLFVEYRRDFLGPGNPLIDFGQDAFYAETCRSHKWRHGTESAAVPNQPHSRLSDELLWSEEHGSGESSDILERTTRPDARSIHVHWDPVGSRPFSCRNEIIPARQQTTQRPIRKLEEDNPRCLSQ